MHHHRLEKFYLNFNRSSFLHNLRRINIFIDNLLALHVNNSNTAEYFGQLINSVLLEILKIKAKCRFYGPP